MSRRIKKLNERKVTEINNDLIFIDTGRGIRIKERDEFSGEVNEIFLSYDEAKEIKKLI